MASPSKRMRMSPKSSQIARTTQNIHGSNNESPPVGLSCKEISPNISAILSNETVRTRLSDVFELDESKGGAESACDIMTSDEEEELASSICPISSAVSEFSNSPLEEDYDAYFDNLGRIKYSGLIWKIYKPLFKNTLYDKILEDPSGALDIVRDLLLLYSRKPDQVLQNLIGFCLDVAGFQNFDITKYYKFNENSAKEVINLLESDEDIDDREFLKSSGRYLLMESRSSLAKTFKIATYNFFKKLILTAHDNNVLYDEHFAKNLFTFIKCMSFSNMLAIRHTGVTIAMKVLSALVLIYSKIINECNLSEESGRDDSEVVRLHTQKEALSDLLEYFFIIFTKNCRLQENKMLLMRIECIRESHIWVKYFPKIFISELQVVSSLTKLIVDMSKEVRYAALEACERCLDSPNIIEYLNPFMDELTEVISKRFFDVDYNVAVKAIDIFTSLMQRSETFVSAHLLKLLTSLVFDKVFPVAEAASRFLTAFFQVQRYSSESILENMAKISLKKGDCTKQLVVEGFLYCCKETQNWQLYLKLLFSDEIKDMQMKESLAEMFAEAVHQVLVGKSTKMRISSRKVVDIDSSEHLKVAKLYPTLNKLLQVSAKNPKILIEILKIFPLVNANIPIGNFCREYLDLLSTIHTLYGYHSDESLLNKLAETMYHFCNITNIAERAQRATATICTNHVKELRTFLSKPTKARCSVALKVAILYSHFNLTEHFTWEELSDCWSDVNENTVAALLMCCKWFLIWNLRNLSDLARKRQTKSLPNLFSLFQRTCNEFTSSCFNMIQNLRGQQLHFQVYETICDFYIRNSNELETPIKFNKQFEDLRLKVDDSEIQKALAYFLNEYIISNRNLELIRRREYVIQFIDLVHNSILPIEALAIVLKLYYVNFDEYGSIIEASLSSISQADDENTICLVIAYTLTVVYEDILNKHSLVDINTDESKQLKLLVKQFIAFKHFRGPRRHFKKLLYFSIKYSLKDETKYAFLYFVRYFIDLLSDVEDKMEVFDFFKKKLPVGAEKNDAVLFFGNYFKNVALKKAPKNRQNDENKKKSKSGGTRAKNKKADKTSKKPITSTPVTEKIAVSRKNKKAALESETEFSEDDITIHDSESDDLDLSIAHIRI